MQMKKAKKVKKSALVSLALAAVVLSVALFHSVPVQAQDAAQPAIARRIGAIKAINGNTLTLAPDSGPAITVTVQPNARLLRIAPGEKDLKNAAPVQLQELQVGDRVRVRGQASADAASIAALEVIVMPHSDIEARHQQELQDWQKRGIGGPVSAVDPAAGTVTITTSSLAGKKTIVVHASKTTVIRRYAPDSAKPEDAKVITLREVNVGDQLRARGDRSADGGEVTAEEIFTGIFPQFPALIKSIDASAGTLSVQDLGTKKIVEIKVTADSQLHKIPDEMAQGIARGLKAAGSSSGSQAGAANGQSPPKSAPPGGTSWSGGAASGRTPPPGGSSWSGGAAAGGGGNPGGARSGGGDFQRRLDQTPTVTLADLHKGDALYVITTEGTPSGGSTVIKMFAGVEPILQAPNGSQAMSLAPWSLGGAPGGDAQ
jgi:hypothetical protein